MMRWRTKRPGPCSDLFTKRTFLGVCCGFTHRELCPEEEEEAPEVDRTVAENPDLLCIEDASPLRLTCLQDPASVVQEHHRCTVLKKIEE